MTYIRKNADLPKIKGVFQLVLATERLPFYFIGSSMGFFKNLGSLETSFFMIDVQRQVRVTI